MTPRRQSDIFKSILTLWRIFLIWFGRNPTQKHKYYSYANILINLVLFDSIFTVSLCFSPRQVKFIIPELIFYFTEIAILSKVFMVVVMRDKILEAFNIMDGKDLEGDDESTKEIIERDHANFRTFFKFFIVLSQLAYFSLVFVPLILYFAIGSELKLPISQYYFLSDETRERYFIYLYIYQNTAYSHMMYTVTVDLFLAGLLLTAVTQLRVLSGKLKNLKLSEEETMLSFKDQEEIQTTKLRNLLTRYELVLKYCNIVQEILSFNVFVVFGLSSIIICVTLCELLFLPTTIGFFMCMVFYLVAMLLQIFIPTYLGTLIYHESTELVFAVYCTEWIPRSESFKKSLKIFLERAKRPIKITGLKIFLLSLSTFTSIVKTAYSIFTLIRNIHE